MNTKQLAGCAALTTAVAVLFVGAKMVPEYQARAAAKQEAAFKAELIASAEQSVRQKLKDPSSAIFTEERIIGEGVHQRVCGLVNAKNSFGGYTGPKRFVSFLSAVAYVGDEKPFEAMWDRPEHPCDVF